MWKIFFEKIARFVGKKAVDYNLFLDDNRNPTDPFMVNRSFIYVNYEWVIVRSYADFVKVIKKNGIPKFISFDHDISDFDEYGNELTGYDCAKWLVNYCDSKRLKLPTYFIHSQNTTGSRNIFHYLKNAKRVLDL